MESLVADRPTTTGSIPFVRVDRALVDLASAPSATLKLSFPLSVWDDEHFLVIDLYSAANPVHPAGHIGWWKWPLDAKGDVRVEVSHGETGFAVTFDGLASREQWTNPDYLGLDEPVIALHVVLRPVLSEAVRFDDILPVYCAAGAAAAAHARRSALDQPSYEAPSVPWYSWPGRSRVHIAATNIFERDAVGNFAMALHRLLRSCGVRSRMYADSFDPALRGTILPTCDLPSVVGRDDVLLVNYSIYDRWLPTLVELRCKKVLYFHNITPPRYLQVYDAEFGHLCESGMEQLRHLAGFDALVANSAASARALERLIAPDADNDRGDVFAATGPFAEASRLLERAASLCEDHVSQRPSIAVCPPIVGLRDWEAIAAEPIDVPDGDPLLLYVGRVAPHKRIEDLFALLNGYRQKHGPAELVIAGSARFAGYLSFLQYLMAGQYAHVRAHIHFCEEPSDGQLKSLYERATALVTMSEHEGFCVPPVEAMAFDLPVFAYADPAVRETLGQSGRVFHDKDFPHLAADMARVLGTPWLKRQIIDAQQKRLRELAQETSGVALWKVFETVLYGERTAAK